MLSVVALPSTPCPLSLARRDARAPARIAARHLPSRLVQYVPSPSHGGIRVQNRVERHVPKLRPHLGGLSNAHDLQAHGLRNLGQVVRSPVRPRRGQHFLFLAVAKELGQRAEDATRGPRLAGTRRTLNQRQPLLEALQNHVDLHLIEGIEHRLLSRRVLRLGHRDGAVQQTLSDLPKLLLLRQPALQLRIRRLDPISSTRICDVQSDLHSRNDFGGHDNAGRNAPMSSSPFCGSATFDVSGLGPLSPFFSQVCISSKDSELRFPRILAGVALKDPRSSRRSSESSGPSTMLCTTAFFDPFSAP
eukprot:scaffold8079_cov267-Pinguiococcus_pyrenoidosus.AAC.3